MSIHLLKYSSFGRMDLSVCIFVAVVLIVLLLRRKSGAPTPPALPLIGYIELIRSKLRHRTLADLSVRYGPLFSLRLGFTKWIVVSNSEMATEILKTHDATFSYKPKLATVAIMFYGGRDLAFAQYGPQWKHMRTICKQQLFTAGRISSSRNVRREELDLTVQSILSDSLAGRPVDLNSKLSNLATNMITRMAISKKYFGPGKDADAHVFIELVHETFRLIAAPNLGDFFPFLAPFDLQGYVKRATVHHYNVNAFLDRILDEMLQQRKTEKIDNLMGVLLEQEQDHEAVKAIIEDIIMGGTDPAATALEWALAELITNPMVMEKVQHELDRMVGNNRQVEEEDIANLEYVQAIVKETLRLHPPSAFLPHACSPDEDGNAGGYHIPKGTYVLTNTWQIGRDPKAWENPNVFNPDRFIGNNIDVKGRDFDLIPFGSGRRMCPGMPLGLCMLHIILARLLHTFNWSPDGEIDLSDVFGASVHLKNPLHAFATPRYIS